MIEYADVTIIPNHFPLPYSLERFPNRRKGEILFLIIDQDDPEKDLRITYCRELALNALLGNENKKLHVYKSLKRMEYIPKYLNKLEKDLGIPESNIIVYRNAIKFDDIPYWAENKLKLSALLFFIKFLHYGYKKSRKYHENFNLIRSNSDHYWEWAGAYESVIKMIKDNEEINYYGSSYIKYLNESACHAGIHRAINGGIMLPASMEENMYEDTDILAVYGQLKKEGIAHRLLKYCEFIDTIPKKNLIIRNGDCYVIRENGCLLELVALEKYPELLYVSEEPYDVEFYKVNKDVLKRIDTYEGHPGFYTRDLFYFSNRKDHTLSCKAWAYAR